MNDQQKTAYLTLSHPLKHLIEAWNKAQQAITELQTQADDFANSCDEWGILPDEAEKLRDSFGNVTELPMGVLEIEAVAAEIRAPIAA